MVSRIAHAVSDLDIRRPAIFAASGRVNISDITSNGWTSSNVPKASAAICSPYPVIARMTPAHHFGRDTTAHTPDMVPAPSGSSSASRWRMTVPHAMVNAEPRPSKTARS